jgi:hypothetical protein
MTFFELFDQFFQLEAEQTIPPMAAKLYMYWLHEFNNASPRWPAKLHRRANQVYADLNVDKKTLEKATEQLVQRGLIRHIAGTKLTAGTWFLNYEEAANWSLLKGNNSPQETEIGPFSGGNNTPKNPNWSLLKGNNSPPIRNRPEESRPDQTKKNVGVAAEEITLAPLPAKNQVSAPRCEAPPTSAAAQLPEAVATEAKLLANQIGQLWHITEIKNQPKWARIHTFCRRLAVLGRLDEVQQQFAGYRLQRDKAGIRPHQLDTWLGKPADDFADGEWCGCDWAAVAADTRSRPGEPALATLPVTRVAAGRKFQND